MSNRNGTQTVPPPTRAEVDVAKLAAAHRRRQEDQAGRLSELGAAATAAIIFGFAVAFVGAVAGLMMAISEDGSSYRPTHPLLGAGIGVGAGSVVVGVMMILFGAWAKAWAGEYRR